LLDIGYSARVAAVPAPPIAVCVDTLPLEFSWGDADTTSITVEPDVIEINCQAQYTEAEAMY